MVAAIYARKSTDQNVPEEMKSVTRQVENARAFAQRNGWTVLDSHVYMDDGISGAEFEKRPGLQRLLANRRQFSVLVVSERKSIGREASETAYTIKQLDESGVEVWSYLDAKCLTPRNALDKVLSSVQGFSDEDHREKTSRRVAEAHTRLHQAGHVTGGRVFGYRNVHVYNGFDQHGNPLRSHTDLEINPAEEAVVLRIFRLYDSGLGLKRIAKILTAEQAIGPKPFRLPDGLAPLTGWGWAPSTIRSILTRELYRGVKVRNKTRKKNAWGKKDVKKRPPHEWERVTLEHLRIVPEELWQRVAAMRAETEGKSLRLKGGRLAGRPPKGTVQNLLSGLATCGVCGGGLVVEYSNNRKGRYAYYMCHRRRHYGTSCTNALRIPVGEMNEAVLQAVESHVLTPAAVESLVVLTEQDDARKQRASLVRERKEIEKRIARLVAIVESAGDITSLAAKLRELEARRTEIDDDLRSVQPLPRLAPEVVEDRLAEWRRLLRSSVTQGRAVLQRALSSRIVFTPREDGGYDFQADTRFDKLFSGCYAPRPAFIPTGGVPNHIGPEDTFDADYGRLLAQVARYAAETGKVKRARQDSNLRPPA